jgi:secreted trypsin-like serine protease
MEKRILVLLMIIMISPVYLKSQFFDINLQTQTEEPQREKEYLPQGEIHRDGPTLGRIVGGSNAVISDYPWQVALMTSSGFQFCGGSVIHPEWILTAAHCLGGTIYIRAGVTNRTHTTGQDRLVIAQYGHPGFVGSTHVNDIALLKLQTPLNLDGPNVKAIPIVTAAHAELGYTQPGTMARITGWGATSEGGSSTNILQMAQVPITTQEYAQEGYAAWGYTITPDMLPAGYPQGGTDACQGDSGGPIVVADPNSPVGYLLAGETTWGIGCARPNLPGIYARNSHFEEWITNIP